MKILQVISSFPPAYSYGGATKVAYDISKELVKKGHEVTVYTTDVHDANSRLKYDKNPIWMDGIEVYHFKNISNNLAHKNYSLAPMMASKMAKKIKDFDVIHLHEYRSAQAIYVQYYAKRSNVPYILQAHGAVMPSFSKKRLKRLFDLYWGNLIIQNASKIICLTQKEADQYKIMNANPNKIEIVPNGIDLSEYENLPDRGIFRNKYGIRNDEKIVLYLARIHPIKGGDLLVEAFSDLIPKMEGVRLVIAGPDDGFLPALKEKIEVLNVGDKIIFVGPLYGRDKLEAYVDANVYVLPSVYEIFGVTVLEAYACGTPAIVTDRCGISSIVEKVGYVVEYDKKQLMNALFRMLSDERARFNFGEEGRKTLERKFKWDEILKQTEQIYIDITK